MPSATREQTALNRTFIDFHYAKFGMFVKKMLFLLGYETLFAQNRDTEGEI